MQFNHCFATKVLFTVHLFIIVIVSGEIYTPSSKQYHIQTDEGPERYFRYQTLSGQYRKEKRLEDGSVVGMYAWIDDNGFLRQNDYVADNAGYRILKEEQVFVGKQTPIDDALSQVKKLRKAAKTSANQNNIPSDNKQYTPIITSKSEPVSSPNSFQLYYKNRNSDKTEDGAANFIYRNDYDRYRINFNYRNNEPYISGFRYFIPRAYQEEQTLSGDEKFGSFGYIDPFGIRRVVYYNTAPGSGFNHKKHNTYVGFQAPPYDPLY